MDRQLQYILNEYEGFQSYTKLLNEEMPEFNKFSRKELKEFQEKLQRVQNLDFHSWDLNDIIQKKKEEEFPQLLKVHHYPEINDMDFLSEDDKIKLDTYLMQLGNASYMYFGSSKWKNISAKWDDETKNKVIEFLVDKNIIEKYYEIQAADSEIMINAEELRDYERYFELSKKLFSLNYSEQAEYDILHDSLRLHFYVVSWDEDAEIEEDMIEKAKYNKYDWMYKVIKDRDTSLDNV